MSRSGASPYRGSVAVLATMHGKEQVIGPLLEHGLGLRVALAHVLNTDRFGTFSRDIARTGTPLESVRAKSAATFDHAPDARVGVASEGSFGSHPLVAFLPLGHERILLIDRETGLEVSGQHADPDTNYSHALVIHDR